MFAQRDLASASVRPAPRELSSTPPAPVVALVMPQLDGASRTTEALKTIVEQRSILRFAVEVDPRGRTIFQSLLEDAESLGFLACDGELDAETKSALLSHLVSVAKTWLRVDVVAFTSVVDHSLHMHRMFVLRCLESLRYNTQCCDFWRFLGMLVAVETEQHRHTQNAQPISAVQATTTIPSPRVLATRELRTCEAKLRLWFRQRILTVVASAQNDANVRKACATAAGVPGGAGPTGVVLAVWAATLAGLRFFARRVNDAQCQKLHDQDPSVASEMSFAIEALFLNALQQIAVDQERNVPPSNSRTPILGHGGTSTKPTSPPLCDEWVYGSHALKAVAVSDLATQLRSHTEMATTVSSEACLLVPCLDAESEKLSEALRNHGTLQFKSELCNGLAPALLVFEEPQR